ncbi:DUF2089 domain-containing protein [soil metagenome]
MQILTSLISCPNCKGALHPTRLQCRPCDLSIEGDFQLTEFSCLNAEDLHFLRIFIHCEGSIREMESALGLSYPTIKSRLANLKKRLALDGAAVVSEAVEPTVRSSRTGLQTIDEVLSALERGEIDHAESLKIIRKLK